jgi:hypothetical protein
MTRFRALSRPRKLCCSGKIRAGSIKNMPQRYNPHSLPNTVTPR